MNGVLARDGNASDVIVRSAATGDQIAFATLVAEHHAAMARVAFVICGDPELTRDATQAAWVVAWRQLRSLRNPSSVRAWLVAIAANETRRALRRTHRGRIADISPELAELVHRDPAEDVDLVDLASALAGLRPEDRQLLALRYEAGLDSSEIARHLGLSASGVRTRLSRTVERLRTRLASTTEALR